MRGMELGLAGEAALITGSSRGIGRATAAALVMAALLPAPAAAVVVRHDTPDVEYVRKARELPSYCRMMVPDGGGALVAPGWVLTAAHLAPALRTGHQFRCGAEELQVAEVVVHPNYDENIGRHDLALVRLSAPSAQKPLKLSQDPLGQGEVVNLIGHWQSGTGLTGASEQFEKKPRAATNAVSAADENWLRFVFDAPSSLEATALEGVSGGGDSGAPAYLFKGGEAYLVGVGSRNSDTNRDGVEQNYGDTDLYVAIPAHLPWIRRVLDGRETDLTRWMARHGSVLPWALAAAATALVVLALFRWRRGLTVEARAARRSRG